MHKCTQGKHWLSDHHVDCAYCESLATDIALDADAVTHEEYLANRYPSLVPQLEAMAKEAQA